MASADDKRKAAADYQMVLIANAELRRENARLESDLHFARQEVAALREELAKLKGGFDD